MIPEYLHKPAAIAARFHPHGGASLALRWPVVTMGALFGSDGSAVFFAGDVDMVDGWLIPASLNLDKWAELVDHVSRGSKQFFRELQAMERAALKDPKGWRHVEELGATCARVPQIWGCFKRDVAPLQTTLPIDAELLLKIRTACRDLEDTRIGQVHLAASQVARATAPLHVFFSGRWRGVVMPCREPEPDDNTVPAPQKFAGVAT
jgi:hypothetical protein